MFNASGVQVHVYMKVHVCILYAVSYRRWPPTFSAVDKAQGLFSRIYPPPPTSNSIHSWHVCTCTCMYVYVGCEWPYGAWGLGESHQGAHWHATNWVWQHSGGFNTSWVWVCWLYMCMCTVCLPDHPWWCDPPQHSHGTDWGWGEVLLANWGLVADVDIESEKFRKIGEKRFVLSTMKPWPDAY